MNSSETLTPEKLLGIEKKNTRALVQDIKAGFPFNTLVHIAQKTTMPIELLALAIGVGPEKFKQRERAGRLTANESDRLFTVSLIVSKAIDLFDGNSIKAAQWLLTFNPALGNITPLEMTDTDTGSREVEALIGRLSHGIFSNCPRTPS